jgi:hypothetical protein
VAPEKECHNKPGHSQKKPSHMYPTPGQRLTWTPSKEAVDWRCPSQSPNHLDRQRQISQHRQTDKQDFYRYLPPKAKAIHLIWILRCKRVIQGKQHTRTFCKSMIRGCNNLYCVATNVGACTRKEWLERTQEG